MTSPDPANRRIMGIDYGSVRIGLAVGDPLGILAHPRGAWKNNDSFWTQLAGLVKTEGISLVVVGMPLNLKGQKGKKAEEVDEFISRLKRETGLEVVTWDERFTTSIAQRTLIEMGTKKKDRRNKKHNVDAMAAALILQSFLDSTKKSFSC